MITPVDELDSFFSKSTQTFALTMLDVVRTMYTHKPPMRSEKAVEDLQNLIGNTMTLADLYGRKRVFMEFDGAKRTAKFADPSQGALFQPDGGEKPNPLSKGLPFEEAVQDIVRREPRFTTDYREIQRIYSERHAIVFAHDTERTLTERVQKLLAEAVEEGKSIDDVGAVIQEITPWTQAYADTCFRTQVATAYSAGRFKQSQDSPEIKEFMPAFEFTAMMDGRERPSHGAAHGTIAPTDDVIWERLTPPLYYQCRCGIRLIGLPELERRGLIRQGRVQTYLPPTFAAARPTPDDPWFLSGRPDRRIY